MKYIVILLLVLFATHAGASFVPENIPKDAYTFDFNIKTVGMSWNKERKLDNSIDILREIYASPEFKERILNFRYRGRRQFWKNNGFTNAQIYRRILQGVERLYPYYNNAMDVEVQLYTDNKSIVVGYTNARTRRIWMNTKYFNKSTPAQVAAHLTHEWLHKLGFDHERTRCEERKFSVPYAVGYIVRDIAKKYGY